MESQINAYGTQRPGAPGSNAPKGFMSRLADNARGAVLAGSLMAGGMTPAPTQAPTFDDGAETSQTVGDEGYDPVETLRQSQAQAGMAQASASVSEAVEEVDKQIQGQADSINYWLLQALSYLISFDASCFGLTLPLTLPLYDALIIPIFGYELYNSWTGNESLFPYFPRLSWQSFFKPGGGDEQIPPVPLPETPLQITILAIIIILGVASFIEVGLISIVFLSGHELLNELTNFFGISLPGI